MRPFTSKLAKLALSTLSAGCLAVAIAPAASAFTLVPDREGEINAGVGPSLSNDGYLDTSDMGYTVESLDFEVNRNNRTTTTRSRLFADRADTGNTYNGGVAFRSRDIGTSDNNGTIWLRPVAMIQRGSGILENGQLEAGLFRFNFTRALRDLTLSFFDVESRGTSILRVNGEDVNLAIARTGDRRSRSISLSNVRTLEVMIGNANTSGANRNDRGWRTGDGVLVSGTGTTEDVPEPATMASIALAAGGLGWMRRRRQQQVAEES